MEKKINFPYAVEPDFFFDSLGLVVALVNWCLALLMDIADQITTAVLCSCSPFDLLSYSPYISECLPENN
jgi:hypothetical protein